VLPSATNGRSGAADASTVKQAMMARSQGVIRDPVRP
jgi:hypothetical protein